MQSILFFLGATANKSSGGLNDMATKIIEDWIGPVYLIVGIVAVVSLVRGKQMREMIKYIAIFLVGAIMVYGGIYLFGKDGVVRKNAQSVIENQAGKITDLSVIPMNYQNILKSLK